MHHHRAKGWELLRLRRPRAAIASAQAHLRSLPDDADAHRLLALALAQLGDDAAARANAEQSVQLEPEVAASHYALAIVHARARRWAEARAAVVEALRIDPDFAAAHSLQSNLLLDRGDLRGARDAAGRALALEPGEPGHHESLVRALRALGEVDPALSAARHGLGQHPEDPDLHLLHGELLLARGDAAAAAESFLACLRGNPEDEHARSGLLEALRARHAAYRPALWLRQGIVRLVRERRWSVLLASVVVCLLLAALLVGSFDRNALTGAAVAVLLVPRELGNLLLLPHPLGWRALRPRERGFAVATGCCLLAAVGFCLAGTVTGIASLRQAAKMCGASALTAAFLHFLVGRSAVSRTTRALFFVLVLVWAAGVLGIALGRRR